MCILISLISASASPGTAGSYPHTQAGTSPSSPLTDPWCWDSGGTHITTNPSNPIKKTVKWSPVMLNARFRITVDRG